MEAKVRVGVGVFVFNSAGSFIVGKRKGSHGAGNSSKANYVHFYCLYCTIVYIPSGTWALPGGHLEFGESFETCATREVLEETGIQVKGDSVRFLTATNDVMASEHKHYVTIFMGCRLETEGLEPRVGMSPCTRAGEEPNVRWAIADL